MSIALLLRRSWLGFFSAGLALSALAAADPAPFATEPYVWRNVAIGGGGFVTGIVTHPRQKGLIYARTDVGGAYRWDDGARRWIPLTDWIAERDANLMGIESLAVDPRDPQRLYLAAGTYSRLPAAMLRSSDQGRTFQRTDVPIAMGGNEMGRFAGERLAVDPNDSAVLFFGSRRDGLWRSGDGAATWQRVASFPNVPETPVPGANPKWNQAVGIVAVVFDPEGGREGQPTRTVYAAVATTEKSLFRSVDGGATWTAVADQPTGQRPNHAALSPDGMLYLSYAVEPGPGQMTGGSVWRLDLRRGGWADISPIKGTAAKQPFGYGAVTIDPQHPATVLVTTFTHWKPHDQIFRSRDQGATWTGLWDDDSSRWDYANAPYTAARSPHWLGTVVVNPFDSEQVWFTTGYGVWASTDVSQSEQGRPVHWQFLDNGLEETVPLALVSPPIGAHLISGVGDVDGFRHEDIDVSPAAGSFPGPRFSSTRDLSLAAGKPTTLVRIGNAGRGVTVHIASSEDGGRNWLPFVADPPNGANGQGRIAVTADGATVIWSLSNGTTFVTSDRGATWTPSAGVSGPVSLVADPIEVDRIYACDPVAGKVLISSDAGRHFDRSAIVFAGSPAGWRGEVLAVAPGRSGDLWVGTRAAGLCHSTDGGASFEQRPDIDAADALGFGKAAPGKTTPAIFLRGSIAGRAGFFRSDNGGASWVRINDDEHQFGGANRPMIVGDPRIYGRVYLTTGGRGIIYGDRK